MIKIEVTGRPFHEVTARGYVVFCTEDAVLRDPRVKAVSGWYTPLQQLIEQRGFKGADGSSLAFTAEYEGKPVQVMLFGVGRLDSIDEHARIERFRRTVGNMIRLAEAHKLSILSFALPDPAPFACDEARLVKELMSTAMIAHYQFNQHITQSDRKVIEDITISCSVPQERHKEVGIALEHGERIGHAVNQARDWCNTPANLLNTEQFAEKAEVIAATHGLKCTVFDKKKIESMKMGGLIAVSQGSVHEPRLVIMEYKTDVPKAPTIAIVGKGIMFDSGGLSIKPAKSMETMKDDMAGGAAVISTMEAIAHLKPKVNVIAAVAMAENMVSGTAGRPGDIITFYNGKTAEVRNTDAEGRLVLADALSYVTKQYNLDAVIDLATLTGACVVALGHFFSGLMSQHDAVADKIKEAAKRSGDRVWPLPLADDFKAAIVSPVADLSNIGKENYGAGTITAALFLANFVGTTPWAHIDIAGTAFDVPGISYYRDGATGAGVRLLTDLLCHWHS